MIEKNASQFLAEHPGIKYLFFGGKGGVGKTVMAGAAALWFAQQGPRQSNLLPFTTGKRYPPVPD